MALKTTRVAPIVAALSEAEARSQHVQHKCSAHNLDSALSTFQWPPTALTLGCAVFNHGLAPHQ